MLLTEEQIKEINRNAPTDQGVFFQPTGIPTTIKEHVVYARWMSESYCGGDCWGGRAHRAGGDDEPVFEVLHQVLGVVVPNITLLQYKKLENLIRYGDEEYGCWEDYYGNSSTYSTKYILLSDIENFIEKEIQ